MLVGIFFLISMGYGPAEFVGNCSRMGFTRLAGGLFVQATSTRRDSMCNRLVVFLTRDTMTGYYPRGASYGLETQLGFSLELLGQIVAE